MPFSFKDITLQLGGRILLDCVSAELPDHGCIGLIGRNGAGKTTLLEVLTSYRKPKNGTICIDGKTINLCKQNDIPKQLGYLPQASHLQFPFRVSQFLDLGLQSSISLHALADHPIVKELHLENMLPLWMHELSGGEEQRVRLAQTFLEKKPIYLLDEPFNSLDHWQAIACQDFLANKAQESLLIMVIHDLYLARRVCDSVMILENGKLTLHHDPLETLSDQAISSIHPQSW